MHRRLNTLALTVLLAICAGASNAENNVFSLPALFGSSANIGAYSAGSLNLAGTFTGDLGSNTVLAAPNGSKYYVLGNSVQVVDSGFATPHLVGNFSQPATAAIISPDGQRLIFGAGKLYFVDIATDNVVTPNGISVGGTVVDVAASLDSTHVFTLVNTGAGSQLVEIDVATANSIGTLTIPGFATGVSSGPDGLLYVTTQNQIDVLDPRTFTLQRQIALNGYAGKMVFTADGKLGLAVNSTPITGYFMLGLDLATGGISFTVPSANFPQNATLDKLFPVGNDRAFAYSSVSHTLFDVTLSTQAVSTFVFAGFGQVTSVTTSHDIATPFHSTTQYLLFASQGVLYRIDLSLNQITAQIPLTTTGAALSFAGPVSTNTPVTMLKFGDVQTVALGGTALPLVIRLADAQGNPVVGAAVSFSTSATGATLTTLNAVTNYDGFASTTLTVPNASSIVNVVAASGNLSQTFTTNVGFSGAGAGNLSIVSGQGLLVGENTTTAGTAASMVVVLNDSTGSPVPGAVINFALSGPGTLLGGVSTNAATTQVTTDSNGQATVDFLSSSIFLFPGFVGGTVTVSSVAGSTVTFYVTTVSNTFPPTAQIIKPNQGTILTGQAGQVLKGAIMSQVVASSGQPIPNISLRLVNYPDQSVGAGAGCLNTFALTDSTGVATCDVALFSVPGEFLVTPNVGYGVNESPVRIRITPSSPGAIKIIQGDGQSGLPGTALASALIAEVDDAFGNALAGTSVTWKVSPANGATLGNVVNTANSGGRVSATVTLGNTAGAVQVTVTAGSITKTFNLTVLTPATGLQISSGNIQTTQINTDFASLIAVKLADAQGNGVNNVAVTFTVTSGAAILATPAPITNAQGIASTKVTAGGSAGAIVITASSSGFSVTFTLIARLPGPTNLVFLNGASFQAGISPGVIVTIRGNGIAPGVQGLVTAFSIVGALPATLAGVTVTFNGISAPIYYVMNSNGVEQVTVQVPFELSPGNVNVTITAPGGGSASLTVQLLPVAPGVFENLYGNQKVLVGLRPDGSYISPSNPARRGEIIRVYVTGLGQVSPLTATNDAGAGQTVSAQIVVGLNNGGVPLISAQYAPGMVGVYVLTLQVPANTQTGPAQPFGLVVSDSTGTAYYAPSTFLPIQ